MTPKPAPRAWTQRNHSDLHWLLIEATETFKRSRGDGGQALHCPYYVPLEGALGSDWGIIVNPESFHFAKLVFEHDDCGCPTTDTEDDEGWGRHVGCPDQDGDMWDERWRHECDDWCEPRCAEKRLWGKPLKVAKPRAGGVGIPQ